ncbi:MAG: protein kinase family protein [Deltaproteobacteria bacterium]|nr:protein kinase family protein [Deltaproteobacteria bacterium]
MEEKLIEFIRTRDYKLVKELGQGACGKTVLLYDDMIDEHFVCKKYCPCSEDHRQELFSNFIREIKLLHQVHHANIVRMFNYYLYPDKFTGFILMEFIDGLDIDDYLKNAPEKFNEIFLQVINGFRHLETNKILHRDIRYQNMMVTNAGTVKIIDLGFGKKIKHPDDFDKSISLNWWCELPEEFEISLYDFRTEVYFVGKLFEKMIREIGIDHFAYKSILNRMCSRSPDSRIESFFDVEKEISNNRFPEMDFSQKERSAYREFADSMQHYVTKIESGSKYIRDFGQLQNQLEEAYRSFLLEETVPNTALIARCFISGSYYNKKAGFPVRVVSEFLHLLKSSSQEKIRIIMANLYTRLDSIPRYSPMEDDIPF